MKKLHAISMLPLMLIFLSFTLLSTSCKKAKMCEENNTFTLVLKNTALSGNLNVKVDEDFRAINSPGDYSVGPGETMNVELRAGSHTVYARNIRTSCSGGRCSTTVTGYADKTVNQQSCTEANAVY